MREAASADAIISTPTQAAPDALRVLLSVITLAIIALLVVGALAWRLTDEANARSLRAVQRAAQLKGQLQTTEEFCAKFYSDWMRGQETLAGRQYRQGFEDWRSTPREGGGD